MSSFLDNTSFISYSPESFHTKTFTHLEEIQLGGSGEVIQWLNTYGLEEKQSIIQVIKQNKLDDFLIKLLTEHEHSNKVLELDEVMLVSIHVLKTEKAVLDVEQMFFVSSADFIWSLQEKQGDYFEWIRERLMNNKGIVRKKRADYLLFLILESIINNYEKTFQSITHQNDLSSDLNINESSSDSTKEIEQLKHVLFSIKKASISLRDTSIRLEKITLPKFKTKYFSEIKEQIITLIADIDFEIMQLESKTNLIYSIQGHRLNEVMKTLTIFSVIFIPLTFLAGIYGMNFKYIPELESDYGYFYVIGIMLLIAVINIWYFRKKKWF